MRPYWVGPSFLFIYIFYIFHGEPCLMFKVVCLFFLDDMYGQIV